MIVLTAYRRIRSRWVRSFYEPLPPLVLSAAGSPDGAPEAVSAPRIDSALLRTLRRVAYTARPTMADL
jgi:hypothetical protein